MPIYEYDCPKCGRFDAIQKIGARPLAKHDACGSKVKKLMSAGAFAFKGTGFYATDYAKKGAEKAESKAEKGSCSTPSGGGACASCPSNPSNG